MELGRVETTLGVKGKLAILVVAACVLVSGVVSGCGVRQGMENVKHAQDVKKQFEKKQHKLEKRLNKKLEEGQ
jgi:hypothetical protein